MGKKILFNVLIPICCIVLLGLFAVNSAKLTNTQTQLTDAQNDLTRTQAELAMSQTTAAMIQTELSQMKSDLETTSTQLADVQKDLDTTSTKLEVTTAQLARARNDYDDAVSSLEIERTAAAVIQATLDNLQVNFNSLTNGYGYVLKDPTYAQLRAFITADATDLNEYVNDTYVCEDYSYDVIMHALAQKIRCAYVSIRFRGDNSGHAIVAFNTTDRGLVYIEPQSDEEVNLHAGWEYWTECVIAGDGHYYLDPTSYDDTIERFNVIW